MEIYVTSDIHGFHENITGPKISKWKNGYRDFESVEEMNAILTDNINKVVKENDILINNGDLVFGKDKKTNALAIRNMIRCRNVWGCRGNHDKQIWKEDFLPQIYTKWFDVLETNINGQDFWFCHYSPEEYYSSDNPHHVSELKEKRQTDFSNSKFVRRPDCMWIFGHYHHTKKWNNLAMDVGVDVDIPEINHKKYTPFHIDEITSYLKDRATNEPCQLS